jgi:hypothetical protein
MLLSPARYFLFAMLVLLAACSRQPSITGEWQLTELRPLDKMSRSSLNLNVTHPDSMEKQLRTLFEERFPGEDFDGEEIKSEIDSIVAFAQIASLRLSSNREFGLNSYGLIVPKAVPGWNFGDRLLGGWDLKKDTLLLTVGDEEIGYTFRFLVLEKSSKTLKLRELAGDGLGGFTQGIEITFSRK